MHDGVWLSYQEPGDSGPSLTAVLIESFLSPQGRPEINEVNAIYLYNTAYLREHQMDFDRLIDDALIGLNVWVVANRRVHVTGARPIGVPW